MTAVPNANPTFLSDLASSIRQRRLWSYLARREIRQQYDRTLIGVFWVPLNVLIHVGVLGLLFSLINDQRDFVPYFACSFAIWTVFARGLGEASTLWQVSGRYLLHIPTPLSLFVIKSVWKMTLIFALSGPVGLLIAVLAGDNPWPMILLLPLTMLLFLANLAWIITLVSIVCARLPDIGKFMPNLVFMLYLTTPILWTTHRLGRHQWIADYNPIYHMIQIVREPMLGHAPSLDSVLIAGIMAIVGLTVAAFALAKARRRIPLWL